MFAILFLSRQPRSAGQWLAVVLLLTWFILPKHSLAQCFQRTDYPVGRNAISIGVGDFNRDGKADLAVANRRPYLNDSGFGDQGPEASIYRLLNNGAGSFGSGISYLIERKNSQFGELFAIGISDFNADGKPDLVANEYLNKFDVVSGDGSGFGGSIQDYPLDGFLEGNFYPRTVVVGDFNADGRPDVATADDNNHQPRIAVLLNNETGGFSERAFYNYGGRYEYSGFSGYDVQSLAVVDLNADGYPDLVALYREYISVLLNNRLGGFNPAVSSRNPDGDYLSSVASGDFNADGRPDVVMTVSNKDYVRVAFGDGRGGFDYITPVRVGANGPKSVKVGDFNGDGEDDIVTANSDSQNVSVLMGTGSYSFATPILIPLGVPSNFLEVGDFNGDRRTDIVTANRESQTISVLIGTAPPAAPSLLTINGQSYPGSQSAVTVSQNSGGVLLLGGCSSGILNWSGSDGRHGRSNSSGNVTIIVPTSATGAFSYTASCEIGTCTSPTAVATVTVTPPPPVPFAITGVTDVLCVSDGNNVRRISFTPQYTGLTGQPITFSVRNELSPTTAFGPYALRVYTDNPTITLQAMQGGTAGMTTFDYNWLAACATPLPALNIRYVKPLTSGTGDGSSWANASGDLRAMLRASAPGNQVWVAAGTYKPTTGTDRTLSFNVPSGVQVYGNFAGTETSLSQRQLSYPLRTVLSGNIGDPAPSVFDNTYHVVTFQNVAAGTLLDGFVVRDGGTGSNTEFPVPPGGYTGAGIYNGSSSGQTSSPTVQNCYVTHNRGAFAGGGMFNGGTGTATLVNCLFSGNYGEHGGAIFSSFRFAGPGDILSNFTVNIINCSLVSNGSDQEGKAIAGGRLNIR
ncbi:MAG: Alkaline phosphatase, partial [Spirosoma sp.]|nr:Alkaline phosphatase [Spirosoma sp.]